MTNVLVRKTQWNLINDRLRTGAVSTSVLFRVNRDLDRTFSHAVAAVPSLLRLITFYLTLESSPFRNLFDNELSIANESIGKTLLTRVRHLNVGVDTKRPYFCKIEDPLT